MWLFALGLGLQLLGGSVFGAGLFGGHDATRISDVAANSVRGIRDAVYWSIAPMLDTSEVGRTEILLIIALSSFFLSLIWLLAWFFSLTPWLSFSDAQNIVAVGGVIALIMGLMSGIPLLFPPLAALVGFTVASALSVAFNISTIELFPNNFLIIFRWISRQPKNYSLCIRMLGLIFFNQSSFT